ncbi:MAG: MarR family transcriptional regulator [Enterococcus sp.]
MDQEEQLAVAIRQLFDKMAWLNKATMEERLKGYADSEVHCIEAIGLMKDPNVTRIAEFVYMTRGAISKLTKRLIKKELIESYQKKENKKEIYFRLTEKGQSIFAIHAQLHKEFRKRDKPIFDQITDDQRAEIQEFIALYGEHLDKEIKKQGLTIN